MYISFVSCVTIERSHFTSHPLSLLFSANHVHQVLQRVILQNVVQQFGSFRAGVFGYLFLIVIEDSRCRFGDDLAYSVGHIFVVVQSGDLALKNVPFSVCLPLLERIRRCRLDEDDKLTGSALTWACNTKSET